MWTRLLHRLLAAGRATAQTLRRRLADACVGWFAHPRLHPRGRASTSRYSPANGLLGQHRRLSSPSSPPA